MSTSPRARVKRASERYRDALEARNVAIVEGRSGGMSLRELAEVTGLGVESVRRILIKRGVS
jgi:hypothetical protein